MAKKGRLKDADLDVLHGLADGIVTQGKNTRERKGSIITHTWVSEEGKTIVKFDHRISKSNPVSIEHIEPNAPVEAQESKQVNNSFLPKTQRKYINPANGKEVGYARAKTLGII